MGPTFLETYVVPVCIYHKQERSALLVKAVGTAFFVGGKGLYMTARHVMEQAHEEAASLGASVGLSLKGDHGRANTNVMIDLGLVEHAPAPFDITIGCTPYFGQSPLRLRPFEAAVWNEVATLGYPLSTHVLEDKSLWLNLRAHRGYIQRVTLPRDMHLGTHPNGFELSFLLSPGMSGCPIFNTNDETVIGVGVGSYKSEQIEEQFVEIKENGQEYREQRVRIEQYGFANDIRQIHNWKPRIFYGLTLLERANG